MSALDLLPGFAIRETAPTDLGLPPKAPKAPNPPPSLGTLGGLGAPPRSEPAIAPPDEERSAIMAEERGLATHRPQPSALMNGLLRAASPLAGTPGARPCRHCGRGIWVSSAWRGPAPDVCLDCRQEMF